MKHLTICLLLLIGTAFGLHAQDKIVLRNGRTIEVKVQRSLENRVEYTYPGETSVYERPKTTVSYILYEDGRKEICDESQSSPNRNSSRTSSDRTATSSSSPSSAKNNKLSGNDEIFWQDVKTTFIESDVSEMTRLRRISATSDISYKDAIQQLKKKAAAMGGTTILIMDDNGEDVEIMGIVYRDENMNYTPRNANERSAAPAESSSNIRRRRITQQMESYNNESNLEFDNSAGSRDNTRSSSSSSRNTPARDNASSSRQTYGSEDSPDAVYLSSGRVIRGTIEEFEPDDFVSIRTPAGKIYEYSMDDVKRISRDSTSKSTAKRASSSSRSSSKYDDNDDRYDNNSSFAKYNDNDPYDNYKVSGYKGTFDAGYNLAMGGTGDKGSFEFNTSHGYQINEYLFVGAGIGLHLYNARDAEMTNPKHYPQYVPKPGTSSGEKITPFDSVTYMHAVDSSYMTFPVFIDVRGYLPLQNSKITPFAMFRFGYAFNLSDSFGGMGLYMNPAIGVKYRLSRLIGINFSVGYAYQSYGGIPKDGGYGYYYYKSEADKNSNPDVKYEAKGAGCISLKLGVEF
ncbi:MAG: DUF4156 domain-containing protein [Tannerella sp.]|jgi:hypothetical protein|nr:DUF4156 domain-containing protein [Tannerella sp.]